jgi:hypothetical protein
MTRRDAGRPRCPGGEGSAQAHDLTEPSRASALLALCCPVGLLASALALTLSCLHPPVHLALSLRP